MSVKEYVENVIAPKLQGDGGWIEYRAMEDGVLTVVFRGECAKCLILERCVAWIEEQIALDLHKTVKVNAIRKRPYFQEV